MDRLPTTAIAQCEAAIRRSLGLHHHYLAETPFWRPKTASRDGHLRLLRRQPGLAPIFLFHGDGYVREAALASIGNPARSAFFVAAIAQRLNDWVEPVRRAAAACAERVYPQTSTAVLLEAAPFLLRQRQAWRRWGIREASLIDGVLARPDVAAAFAAQLGSARAGRWGKWMRLAATTAALDPHLDRLARDALLPDVRATALRMLVTREARWASHREKLWIDKSHGHYRLAWVYKTRPIANSISAEEALALAAKDPSTAVRRIAVVALLTPGLKFANASAVTRELLDDRNPGLRRRAAFALQMQTGAATPG